MVTTNIQDSIFGMLGQNMLVKAIVETSMPKCYHKSVPKIICWLPQFIKKNWVVGVN